MFLPSTRLETETAPALHAENQILLRCSVTSVGLVMSSMFLPESSSDIFVIYLLSFVAPPACSPSPRSRPYAGSLHPRARLLSHSKHPYLFYDLPEPFVSDELIFIGATSSST